MPGRPRSALASPALALALALAGCVAPFAAEEQPAPAPTQRTAFLHSAMKLADAAEENASAVRAGSFFRAWAAGADYPTWLADPPAEDALVTALNVTLFVRATGPVVESARFPDVMVYAGSGDAWMGYGERRDVSAFVPGTTYELAVEVALPAGGLWLPAGESLGLKVVPVMMQEDDQADVEILLGGDAASGATWTQAPLDVPRGRETRGEATGEVVGTVYAGAAAPPTTSHRTPLAIPPDATYVVAWMNTTENVGIPDIDLSLEGPGGATLATSGTPTPREALRIARQNLEGPGDHALVVTTAGSPRATFTLEWVVGAA